MEVQGLQGDAFLLIWTLLVTSARAKDILPVHAQKPLVGRLRDRLMPIQASQKTLALAQSAINVRVWATLRMPVPKQDLRALEEGEGVEKKGRVSNVEDQDTGQKVVL